MTKTNRKPNRVPYRKNQIEVWFYHYRLFRLSPAADPNLAAHRTNIRIFGKLRLRLNLNGISENNADTNLRACFRVCGKQKTPVRFRIFGRDNFYADRRANRLRLAQNNASVSEANLRSRHWFLPKPLFPKVPAERFHCFHHSEKARLPRLSIKSVSSKYLFANEINFRRGEAFRLNYHLKRHKEFCLDQLSDSRANL